MEEGKQRGWGWGAEMKMRGVKKLEKGGSGDLYSSLICDRTAKVGKQRIRLSGRVVVRL